MKIAQIGLTLLFTVSIFSCKSPILLLAYGTEDRLLIYSESNLQEGEITLEIKDYIFCFNKRDFQNVLNKNYEIEFEAYSYLKDFTDQHLSSNGFSVSNIGHGLKINGTKEKYPLSYDIEFIIDKLVKNGQFYIEKKGTQIQFIEYRYWEPQYQGIISSQWIVDNKVIKEFVWGFVD